MAVLHVKSPNGTTYNMTIVTSGTTESFDGNGWCCLPNGLVIQWGTGLAPSDIYHPIAFPTTKTLSMAIHTGTDVSVNIIVYYARETDKEISYFSHNFAGGGQISIFWLALGY